MSTSGRLLALPIAFAFALTLALTTPFCILGGMAGQELAHN
jgi:hypothetical protein